MSRNFAWKSKTKGDKAFDIINIILLALIGLICFYPLYYIVVVSFSKTVVNTYLIPNGFTFIGYQAVISNPNIWRGYANTMIYTVLGVVVSLAATLPGAYAISRRDLIGRKLVIGFVLITMFIGGGLIPTYLTVNTLGLVNTRSIILIMGAVSSYNLIIAQTFFATTIPNELYEAATIDGCGNGRFFWNFVLPLSKPIIAVLALYVGVSHWNSYFTEMVYLREPDKYPLSLILKKLLWQISAIKEMMSNGQYVTESMKQSADLASIMQYVVIVISSVPVMIVYPYLQKYFAKGVMIGSVKG